MLYTQHSLKRKGSYTYDYAREREGEFELPKQSLPEEGQYEIDGLSSDEPFWEPAGVEDELKSQLQDLSLSQDIISWVWPLLLVPMQIPRNGS